MLWALVDQSNALAVCVCVCVYVFLGGKAPGKDYCQCTFDVAISFISVSLGR